MSKKSDEQTTPRWFFDIVDGIFHFDLDAAATKQNSLCKMYYDIKRNGLESKWSKSTWCNPPYSRGQLKLWITKAYDESLYNESNSILLLPGDISTQAFQLTHKTCTAMYAYGKRLKFNGADNCAKFGNVLSIYGYHKTQLDLLAHKLDGCWLKGGK